MSEISDYERAISAYQFQVERYHTWMNYYSLFEGALLVALYSVDRNEVGHLVYLLIPILGFIVSLCWLGSIVGHRCWMNSWLDIIKYLEEKDENKKNKIYNSFSSKQSKKDFLSTQVITQIFISIVIVAWSIVLLNSSLFAFIGGIIAIIVAYKLYKKEDSCIHSKLKNMESLILLLCLGISLSSCIDKTKDKDNVSMESELAVESVTEATPVNKPQSDFDIMVNEINNSITIGPLVQELVRNPLSFEMNVKRLYENNGGAFFFIKGELSSLSNVRKGTGCQITLKGERIKKNAESMGWSTYLNCVVPYDEDIYNFEIGQTIYSFGSISATPDGEYVIRYDGAVVSNSPHGLAKKLLTIKDAIRNNDYETLQKHLYVNYQYIKNDFWKTYDGYSVNINIFKNFFR